MDRCMYDDGMLIATGGALAVLGIATGWWIAIGISACVIVAGLIVLRMTRKRTKR